MEIEDFLPKYPNIENTKYNILNPYNEDFENVLYHKKEFYNNRLDKVEQFPEEKGTLVKHQKTIATYLSSKTPYDKLLMVHSMGLGKCVHPFTKLIVVMNNQFYKISIEELWNMHFVQEYSDAENSFWRLPNDNVYIQSYDVKNNIIVQKNISKMYKQNINENMVEIKLENGKKIIKTQKHKLYCENGWKSNVYYDDLVLCEDYTFSKVVHVNIYFYTGPVYDLEITDTHSYIANGIITHNTCSAIGAIEQIRSETDIYTGAFIFAKGDPLLENFKSELVFKCTPGQYIPENINKLTELEKTHRINKKIKFYKLNTFAKFAKIIKQTSDSNLIENFSNKIIVIDEVHNLRIQSEDDDEGIEIYKQFHRFLHTIKNCKILLLSGTPMKDSIEELASVANLILDEKDQLPTGNLFLEEYMNVKDGIYSLKKSKKQELEEKLRGKVSFLKEAESNVPKKFIGKKNVGKLKHFIVNPNEMSSFQSKHYEKALDEDKGGQKGVYNNSREATLFVYPDGSYGKAGFTKYIIESKKEPGVFRLSDELKNELKGDDNNDTIKKIKKYSCMYADNIERILKAKGNCFVYSSLVQGSGAILFSLLLELVGFSRATGKEKEEGLRYGILTNKTTTTAEIRKINARFNKADNAHGDYIKVLIGSKAIAEGFSFFNVILEIINTPHWNYSETNQAIARGYRLGSHNELLKKNENPVVEICQQVSIPKNDSLSIDLLNYEISEDKDINIRALLRFLMTIAFDCSLNYNRNHVEDGKDYSRECDFDVCDYECKNVDMNEVKSGISKSDLDYLTYNIYYSNPQISPLMKKIENLFRKNRKMDVETIIKNLDEYSEEQIRSSLYLLFSLEQEEYDFETFLEIYTRTPVKKISVKIEEMFRTNFKLSYTDIAKEFKNTEFEIISALNLIIHENITILNKYGFKCFLREDCDYYFLVVNLHIKSDMFSDYYSKNVFIDNGASFKEILESLYNDTLPKMIQYLCGLNESEFIERLKTLPPHIQQMFIENAIIAKKQNIENKNVDIILDLYKSYIKKVDKLTVSTFNGKERCFYKGEWKDCEEEQKVMIRDVEIKRAEKARETNPYGIMGKYNPEKQKFCLVDFQGINDEKKNDRRFNISGKVCTAGFKIQYLMDLVVNRLEIDPPETFMSDKKKSELRKLIKMNRVELGPLYSDEIAENGSSLLCRRILYWGLPPKYGGVRGIGPICGYLYEWFKENDLLEDDNMCGVQGKRNLGSASEKKEKNFVAQTFKLSESEYYFASLEKDIIKIGTEFYKESIKQDSSFDNWIVVFLRKKIAGFLSYNDDNEIQYLCVAKNYLNQKVGDQVAKKIVETYHSQTESYPKIELDIRKKNFEKIKKVYETIGFIEAKKDAKILRMKWKK